MTRTIGSLHRALADVPQDVPIYVDNLSPTGLSSWRGVYRELAIECDPSEYTETKLDGRGETFALNMAGYGDYTPGHNRVEIKQPATVEEFRKALEMAIAEEFEGYKGGQYTMWPDTALWVSEYGRYQRKVIDGVEDLGNRVDLVVTELD